MLSLFHDVQDPAISAATRIFGLLGAGFQQGLHVMAITIAMPLTNARGLNRVILFTGLKFPVVVAPSLMGEPIITAQAYYFLDRLDSVAIVRFESPSDVPSEREIELIVDNYLFAYSQKYPDSKVTSKIAEYVYWRNDPNYHYFRYDWQMTECLVLDTLNDPSIVECQDPYHDTKTSMHDWCLFKPYFQEAFDEYRKKLKNAMSVTVAVETNDHPSLGAGKVELPIMRFLSSPLTLEQVEMLEVVSPDTVTPGDTTFRVTRGIAPESDFDIPQETIVASSYRDAELLAYYFSAIRDRSPVSQFKNYYNVVEYFFEDARVCSGTGATREAEQLEAVLRWAVPPAELLTQLRSLPTRALANLSGSRTTSSGERVDALNMSAADIVKEYAHHVYQLRNACIHSKKTRRGTTTARITPSTVEEMILSDDIPVLQWVAVKCIDKDVTS